jgi:hypothetical protein
MAKPEHIAIDAGVAAALLVALLVVYLVDVTPQAQSMNQGDVEIIHPQTETTKKALYLAVTDMPSYDNMGELLNRLGKGFSFTYINKNEPGNPKDDLENLELLKRFDVVFLTCAASTWQNFRQNQALRLYVEQGGTLYASDWRFDCLRGAFPEYVDKTAMMTDLKPGARTSEDKLVIAKVLDKGLREVLGPEVRLGFDMPGWKPAAFHRNKVTVAMEGTYPADSGGIVENAPLLVKFNHGKGTVIFTSFHNNKQVNELSTKLLNYLVFHAVNARVESELRAKIEEKGFTPTTSSLVSASAKEPSVTKTYRNTKVGPLMFALAFNPKEGVKLRLKVKGPDRKVTEHEEATPFTIQIRNAQIGDWEYTVTALNLDDPNFPFSVSVAEPK